jgi:hypothetical protein
MDAQRFVVSACVTAVGAGAVVGRSKLLRWGATADEVRDALPGDHLVHDPHLTATRAITIQRGAADVWPWIAQLGQGRGGFYSYDRLENLIGCDIHSADRVVSAWQEVRVGHEVRLAPQVALAVALAESPLALVLRGGVPMGNGPPPYDFSWAFVLHEEPPGVTRLVVRERYRYLRAWARLIVEPVAIVSFVMTQRMLRGVRDRAEATEATAADASRMHAHRGRDRFTPPGVDT